MEQTLKLPETAIVGLGFLGSALDAALQACGENVYSIDPCVSSASFCMPASYLPDTMPADAFRRIFCCMSTRGGAPFDYRVCYLETVESLRRRFPQAVIIFCSSSSVYSSYSEYDGTIRRIMTERVDILRQAEDTVLAGGGIVARLTPLYGPGRCELLRRHVELECRLPGPETRRINYLYRDDAVSALLILAEKGERGGIYDVCSESMTHAEVYRLLEECTGKSASQECAPPGRRGVNHHLPDTAPLRALGWRPMQRMEDFFRANTP